MVAALILAAIGTIVLVSYVRDADQRAGDDEDVVNVLVVQQAISRGTPVSEFGARVALREVPVRLRANGAVDSLDSLAGRVAGVDLIPGDQVVSSRLVTPASLSVVDLPPDLHRVTVALDTTRVVGGEVRAGDRVAILASFPGEDSPETHILLHKVLVTGVRTGGDGLRVTSPASGPSPVGIIQVTFALPAPSVERVVFSAEHGSMWLSLENAAASEAGTRIVTFDNVYQP